ncbi:MAG: cell division protein ZipA, partial [Oceanisphaera sp.]|nr:cell division protein ZipA [Oceanisphaera sp.]
MIILGAVAIAALLIHGLWTSQKARQKPMREKPLGTVATGPASDDDCDRDGLGRVRVLGAGKAETGRRQHDDEND